ncbi:MAG: hypothetical protein AB1384_07695 [Actinomycetota bacterium]
MKENRPKTAVSIALCAALLLTAAVVSSCGGEEAVRGWDSDPIVPGYSMAEVSIGDPFSAVQEVHGDPAEKLKDGGYLYAYYERTREDGKIDDPASWRLVVTLYDNGNGYLDGADEVGSIEVSAPYSGLTSGGVGIGSSPGDIEREFGPCENISEIQRPDGNRMKLYSYVERGVDFLVLPPQGAITVVVYAYGGLRPVEEEGDDDDAQGGLFGIYGNAPIVAGQTAAGIIMGDEFRAVKEKYGAPDSTGFTTEGLVYATYTGGYGPWKLNLYLEDTDGNNTLGDFDVVVSISVRYPYMGLTPKGVGISSSTAGAVAEFGPPEKQSEVEQQGERLTILEYNSKGIVFAARAGTGEIVEIDVNRPLAP